MAGLAFGQMEGENKRAELVRRVGTAALAINAIQNAASMFVQDFGEKPKSFEELVELQYLELTKPCLYWWRFELWGDTVVAAIMKDSKLTGVLDTLRYDARTGEYGGGLAEQISPQVRERLIESPTFIQHIQRAKAGDTEDKEAPDR